jgi:hypothetical protein
MKAQSLRRLLTFVNVALALGAVGVGAWWYWKARPAAAADPERAKWIAPAVKAYQDAANNARPSLDWQVREKDFDHIIRPDLMDKKKGPGVAPYVGPVPPKFEPVAETRTVEPEKPKGLAALGKVVSAFVGAPGEASTILFEFTSKRRAAFSVGDLTPIEDVDPKATPKEKDAVEAQIGSKPRRPGKYLTGVARGPDAGSDVVLVIRYDEVGSDATKPPEAKEETLTISQQGAPTKDVVVARGGPAGAAAPGSPGATVARPVDATEPPPLAQIKLAATKVEELADTYVVEPDDDAWRRLSSSDFEKEVLKDVKTEDAKDGKGGVKLTGVEKGSLGDQFGLQPGDILRSINGTAVHSRADAVAVIKALPKGTERVSVEVERNGAPRTYVVDARDPAVRKAAGRLRFK